MTSELIIQSDVLDIIFEKRNKLYGAYTIRKFYNKRLINSLAVTLITATILCAFTFIHKNDGIFIIADEISIAIIPKSPELKKELSKQTTKSTQPSKKMYPIPVIVDSAKIVDTLQNIRRTDITGNINSEVQGDESPGIISETAIGGEDDVETPIPGATINVTQPINNPEIEPSYPGGVNELRKFLEKNLINPTDMEQGETVAVNVKFVVGYDGKLQQFSVVKDGGDIFNNEVIRVLKKMPQWIPGKSNGQNVTVYFTIPIKFVPED